LLIVPNVTVVPGDIAQQCIQSPLSAMKRDSSPRAENTAQPFRRAGAIAYLERKIQTKDEILAELMAEHVALKKATGEL
jgi:hypothetical protein